MPDVSQGKICSHEHTASCTEDVDPHEADTRPTSPVEPTHPMLERDDRETRLNLMDGTATVDQKIRFHVHSASCTSVAWKNRDGTVHWRCKL